MGNTEQELASMRDGLPPVWWALYRGSTDTGFTKEEALYLLGCWIMSQCPNGTFPGKANTKPEDHE